MRSSGCLLQGLLVFLVTIIILVLLGPSVGNVFSDITTQLEPPAGTVITMTPLPTPIIIEATPTPTPTPDQ